MSKENKEIIKNSIFKQKICAIGYSYNSEKIYKTRTNREIREEEIFRCDIAMPLLNVGEEFYIEEMDLLVCINKVVRTSKDNVLYYIQERHEEDENIEEDKKKAEQDRIEYIERQKTRDEERRLKAYYEKSWLYRLFHKYEDFKND